MLSAKARVAGGRFFEGRFEEARETVLLRNDRYEVAYARHRKPYPQLCEP